MATITAPDTVLMIEPVRFGFNEDAFLTNKFQERLDGLSEKEVQQLAHSEFMDFVNLLREANINVVIEKDTLEPHTPDSIFPNNWISTHESGFMVTYPMEPKNRRSERRNDVLKNLQSMFGYTSVLSFEKFEEQGLYMEGTGSMVMDHQNQVIYAALSPRTHLSALEKIAEVLNYSLVTFKAYGKTGELIYHTNVMLCIGETFAIIGADTIEESDREMVLRKLKDGNKELIMLSNDQVYNHFAGNMLQLRNTKGETVLVMSDAARSSINEDQLKLILKHNQHIVSPDIKTIEKVGGGSARCMLAEIYPPKF